MSNVIKMTLQSATPSENGGFILKLTTPEEVKEVKTAFGNKKQTSKSTYYMKVESCPIKVGKAADLDLDLFKVVERDFVLPDDAEENAGETIQLKWLQIK